MDEKQIEIPMGKRVNFFTGMVLGVEEFTQEFDYLRDRMRWLARELLGRGTVSGLQVSTAPEDDARESIRVNPGLAVDGQGNLIQLHSPVHCPPPDRGTSAYLVLQWAERETDPVPISGAGGDEQQSMPSRVEELAVLRYETGLKTARQSGVILARLTKARKLWKIDKTFRVRRRKASPADSQPPRNM